MDKELLGEQIETNLNKEVWEATRKYSFTFSIWTSHFSLPELINALLRQANKLTLKTDYE